MRKNIVLSVCTIIAMAMLAGCGPIPELPEMTEQQEKLVAEYAAGLLLKYDNSYDNALLSEEALAAAEQKEEQERARLEKQKQLADEYVAKSANAKKEEKKESDNKTSDSEETVMTGPTIVANGDIAAFVSLDGIAMNYQGYKITKSYPEDGNNAFSIDAGNGMQLVIASFDMTNISSEDIAVDMFHNSTRYSLELADGSVANNCQTLLLDDFSVYKDTVTAGKSEKVVLLFELNESSDLTGANIVVKGPNGNGIIGL